MSGEDDLSTFLHQKLDGGNGGSDSSVVGNILIVVERYIEISSDEYLLPLQISRSQIPNALLRHGDHSPAALSAHGVDLGGHLDGET